MLKPPLGHDSATEDISATFSTLVSLQGFFLCLSSMICSLVIEGVVFMPCKHILMFHDLPTSAARSVGSYHKLIRHAGNAKISLWHALNAQVSSLNLQLFKPVLLSCAN